MRERCWGTEDEIAFISGLNLRLVEGYLEGAAKRTEWGSVDRELAITHARAWRDALLQRKEKRRAVPV